MAPIFLLSFVFLSFLLVSYADLISHELAPFSRGAGSSRFSRREFLTDEHTSSTTSGDADPLGDSELVDIVLVASVDGKFHALNRTSGHLLWSMAADDGYSTGSTNFSTLAPLVRTKHPLSSHDKSNGDNGNKVASAIPSPTAEFYIVEPQSGDIYVTATGSPLGPLQRFRYSMPELVDMSPFSFKDEEYQRMFVGRKESRLVLVELETGRIREVIGTDECPWNPSDFGFGSEDKTEEEPRNTVNLDELEEDAAEIEYVDDDDDYGNGSSTSGDDSKKKHKPTEVYIGRTDYHISIYTKPTSVASAKRPIPPVQNLSFSVYGPNNQDSRLQTTYTRSKDDKYLASLPSGEVIAFKAKAKGADATQGGNDIPWLWMEKFPNPIVATFDVFRRQGTDAVGTLDSDPHTFVLLQPQPSLGEIHPSLDLSLYQSKSSKPSEGDNNSEAHPPLSNILPNADSAYVGIVEETGSLFAMSPDMYPFVAFGGNWASSGDAPRNRLIDPAPRRGYDNEDDEDDFIPVDELTRRRKEREAQHSSGTTSSSTSSTSTNSARSTSRADICNVEDGGVFDARCLVGVRKLADGAGGVDVNTRFGGSTTGTRRSGVSLGTDTDAEGRWRRLLDPPKRGYGDIYRDNHEHLSTSTPRPPSQPSQSSSPSAEPSQGPVIEERGSSVGILATAFTVALVFASLWWRNAVDLHGLRKLILKHVAPPELDIAHEAGGVIDPNVLANGITNGDAIVDPYIKLESAPVESDIPVEVIPAVISQDTTELNGILPRPRTDSSASVLEDVQPIPIPSRSPTTKPAKLPSTPKTPSIKLPQTPPTPTPSTPKSQARTRKQSTSRNITDSPRLDESDADFEIVDHDVDGDGEGDEEGEGENEQDAEGVEPGTSKRKVRRGKRGRKKRKGAAVDGATPVKGKEKENIPVPEAAPAPPLTPSMIVVPQTPTVTQPSLIVSDSILGFGSHGTVVFRGDLQGRQVAVKRLLRSFVTLASREVSILQESDDHPNVIRYYYQEAHADFLYIALELCPATLADIIEYAAGGGIDWGGSVESRSVGGTGKEGMRSDEWEDLIRCFDPKKALKQIASGLRHLHALKLVHRDIKPQNILVSAGPGRGARATARGSMGGYRMLISDFGLCKKLDMDQTSFLPTAQGAMGAGTVGWRAPEILRGEVTLDVSASGDDQSSRGSSTGTVTNASVGSNSTSTGSTGLSNGAKSTRLTKSVDIFALGCLFYYTLTNGQHPFGDRFEREVNILKGTMNLDGLDKVDGGMWSEEGVEARDLIQRMLSDEARDRPDTTTCLLHPFFWDSGRRLNFLQDASDRFEIMCRDPRDHHLITLEDGAGNIVGNDWYARMDKVFIENLGKFRKYDGRSVQDLLRALRNKKHHYQDLPENVKRHLGAMPEGYLAYFTRRYPRLFMHVHRVIDECDLKDESMFRTYFELPDQ
ncbi:bifunctional endoribonuclease/protein kinase ire1 [Paramarasmius palmivorus]|uniref:non-specific serine/threonine protein kinase n=1 Tax=Paramarasmius palmivorus TaxID=297713 RepID=A0AAW0DQ86_9AGAR